MTPRSAESLISRSPLRVLVVVNNIDHASKRGVVLHNSPDGRGQLFTEGLWLLAGRPVERLAVANYRPASLRRNIEAHQRVVGLQNLDGGLAVTVVSASRCTSSSKTSDRRFTNSKGSRVVLEFRRVFFAAHRTGGVPKHLLHALVREDGTLGYTPAAAGCRLCWCEFGQFGDPSVFGHARLFH